MERSQCLKCEISGEENAKSDRAPQTYTAHEFLYALPSIGMLC